MQLGGALAEELDGGQIGADTLEIVGRDLPLGKLEQRLGGNGYGNPVDASPDRQDAIEVAP